jgi:L-threonate 2-dehydrogenase
MGGAMALHLLDSRYELVLHDIVPERTHSIAAYKTAAIHIASNASEVAQQAETAIVCVVNAVQTQEVLFGDNGLLTATSSKLKTVVLCPTIAPEDTEQFAAQLKVQGIATIDAPMSGGPVRARDGSMSLMVACEDATYKVHEPLLRNIASQLFHISNRMGDGARTKLVNNLLASINLAGAAECLALAERLGLSMQKTLEVMAQSSGQSWIGTERMRRALQNDTTPRAHMSLLAKDSGLAMSAAHAASFTPRLGAIAAQTFHTACEAGLSEADDAALLNWLRSEAKSEAK